MKRIQAEDSSWETMVPPQIVELIKRDRLFQGPLELTQP
jgi:hypothetical protein